MTINIANSGEADMRVIVGHTNADMDCFASMIAASKLYPDAKLAFPGTQNRNVRDFLSLHKDAFYVSRTKDIDLQQISEVIVVDTARSNRIGIFKSLLDKPQVRFVIYDHHGVDDGDIRAAENYRAEVGANVTQMIEKLQQQDIGLTALEATVLSLGLYEDTGCLTFSGTCRRDVQALLFLLDHGAQTGIVGEYIAWSMQSEQRRLFSELITQAKQISYRGFRIVVAAITLPKYLEELAPIVHKLGEVYDADAVFLLVQVQHHTQVIARSYTDEINVRIILQQLGGNGHVRAASANMHDISLAQAEDLVHKAFAAGVKQPLEARDIMSSPVKTITPTMTVAEVGKILFRCGHSGVPVVENDKLVGVISRRDVDKARHHHLGHAPVKGFMSREIVTVEPDASLREMQEKMVQFDIGRLPVVDHGHLIGIVTRSDILRIIHGEWMTPVHKSLVIERFGDQNLEQLAVQLNRCPWSDVLRIAADLAENKQVKVAAVGGFVRDLLLGLDCLDLDLAVEGDGVDFARDLASALGGTVKHISEFKTAQVILSDRRQLDIASARREFYEYPAALPTIEFSSLKQDLARRDFTINAMAVDIGKSSFGKLIDFFGGYHDLIDQTIRVLYNLSFIEDPTRLFRAVRFEQRYDFQMDQDTLRFWQQGLQNCKWQELSRDRLARELLLIFKEPRAAKIIARMGELGLWQTVFPFCDLDEATLEAVDRVQQILQIMEPYGLPQHPWLIIPMILFYRNPERSRQLIDLMSLNFAQTQILLHAAQAYQELRLFLMQPELQRSCLYERLHAETLETLAFLMAVAEDDVVQRRLLNYITELQHINLCIKGRDVLDLGIKSSPMVGRVLKTVHRARLDGEIHTKAEELTYAKTLLAAERSDK